MATRTIHTFCKMIYFIYQQHGVRKAQLYGDLLITRTSLKQPYASLLPLQSLGALNCSPGCWVGEGPTLPLPTEGDSIYLSRLTGCQCTDPFGGHLLSAAGTRTREATTAGDGTPCELRSSRPGKPLQGTRAFSNTSSCTVIHSQDLQSPTKTCCKLADRLV